MATPSTSGTGRSGNWCRASSWGRQVGPCCFDTILVQQEKEAPGAQNLFDFRTKHTTDRSGGASGSALSGSLYCASSPFCAETGCDC